MSGIVDVMFATPTDVRLLNRIGMRLEAKVDAGEFTAFFEATTPGLMRYVARMSNADVAQDIVAETMTTMWTKALDPPNSDDDLRKLQGLAFRIADGHLLNRRRGDRRRNRLTEKLTRETDSGAMTRVDFSEILQGKATVLNRLAALPSTDREVIGLIIDGFSIAEISSILDCSTSATKMRIFRARQQLRTVLAREASHADE